MLNQIAAILIHGPKIHCAVAIRSKVDATVPPHRRLTRPELVSGQCNGLCLALTRSKIRDGLLLCRKAAEEEFYNPELWVNLGKVELEAENKWKAHDAFVRGLHLATASLKDEIRQQLDLLDLRRPPIFSFLARSHPLNVWMGRLTYKSSRQPEA